MEEDNTPTDPGGGRTITIIDVYNMVLETRAEVVAVHTKVDTAIRPLTFPRVPLWIIAAALVLMAVSNAVPR